MKTIVGAQKFEQLIMLGDTHGNFGIMDWHAGVNGLNNICYVQVGDFGVGYHGVAEYNELAHVNKQLKRQACHAYAIRGNHDDPKYFSGKPPYVLSNIHFVPDYTTLKLIVNGEKKNIFCIGGGISVDRNMLVENVKWWRKEKVVFNPKEAAKAKNIDIIVFHISPTFFPPINGVTAPIVANFAKEDPTLVVELIKERNELQQLFDIVYENNKERLKYVFYGHFHESYTSYYDDIKVYMLGINEFKEVI